MKIKQLIAGGIACIMTVSSMLVFATDRAVVSAPFINGDNVTISGEIPDCVEETVVTIQVVKPGGSFGNLEHVYYLGETVSESNGEFSHTINISDLNNIGTEGSFYIYAGAETAAHSEITLDSDGQVIQKFDYFLTSTIKSKAREIFDATSVEQIKGILNSAESKSKFKAMGLLIDKYRALDLKDETAEAVLKLKNILEDNDFEAFYSALPETFNSVFVLDVLNGTWSTTTDMLTALDEFKHLITINPDEYIGLGEAEKTFFDSKIKLPNNGKWNSVNDFEKIWDEAMALITINGETDYQNIWAVLTGLNNIIKLNSDDVEYFATLSGTTYETAVLLSVTGKNFQSADAVRTAFSTAITAVKGKSDTAGGNPIISEGGGSGGGGGGNGNGMFFEVPGNEQKESSTENYTPEFTDVPASHWAYSYIKDLQNRQVVNGNPDGSFGPEFVLTREVFVKMLVLALDLSVESGVNKFKDVSETDWFLPYVGVANSFGIVQGENETTFGVGKPISRQDMTVMVYRALSRLGKAKLPSELADKFADDGDIAQYARKAVYVLKSYGIIDGVGENRFAPGELCTKAQAAKILSEISK